MYSSHSCGIACFSQLWITRALPLHFTPPHPTPPHPTPLHSTPLPSTPLHSTRLDSRLRGRCAPACMPDVLLLLTRDRISRWTGSSGGKAWRFVHGTHFFGFVSDRRAFFFLVTHLFSAVFRSPAVQHMIMTVSDVCHQALVSSATASLVSLPPNDKQHQRSECPLRSGGAASKPPQASAHAGAENVPTGAQRDELARK